MSDFSLTESLLQQRSHWHQESSSFQFPSRIGFKIGLIFCLCSFVGVDILKLVAAQVGTQWIDLYQLLANATEREMAAFCNGYSSDHERAYAALQHWTIRDGEANLAKLINALHRQRRIDVVAKIRWVMEDNPQVGWSHRGTGRRDQLVSMNRFFAFPPYSSLCSAEPGSLKV